MKEGLMRPTKLLTMNVHPDLGYIEYQESVLTHNGKRDRERLVLNEFLRSYEASHPEDKLPKTIIGRDNPIDFELQDSDGHVVIEVVRINEDEFEDKIEQAYTEIHKQKKSNQNKKPLSLKEDPGLGPRAIAALATGNAKNTDLEPSEYTDSTFESPLTTISRKHPNRASFAYAVYREVEKKNTKYKERYSGVRKILLLDNHTSSYSSYDTDVTEYAMRTELLNSPFDAIFMIRLLCVDPKHPESYITELKNNRCVEHTHTVIRQIIAHTQRGDPSRLLPMHQRFHVQ